MRGKFLFVAVVGAIIATGGVLFGTGSPIIEGIAIEGGGRIGTAEIQALSGFHVGQPWSATQQKSAMEAILGLSQVKNISISKSRVSLRGVRVRLEVNEREPVGIVALSDHTKFWVDEDGILLKPADGDLYSPILSGVDAKEISPGVRAVSSVGREAIHEFFCLSGEILNRFQAASVVGDALELTTREGWKALVPVAGLKRQLERLDVIRQKLQDDGVSIWSLLDLRFEGEVTLKR